MLTSAQFRLRNTERSPPSLYAHLILLVNFDKTSFALASSIMKEETRFAHDESTAESQVDKDKGSAPSLTDPRQSAGLNADTKIEMDGNNVEMGPDRFQNMYSSYRDPSAHVWSLYLRETSEEDQELVRILQVGLDQLLIFAGLFGGILTSFLVESHQNLSPDTLDEILLVLRNSSAAPLAEPFQPTTSSLIINSLWFTSLALTLFSALSAVLARGWLAKYNPALTKERSHEACSRHLRYLRSKQWGLEPMVAAIPLLLQVALALFAVGLALFALEDNTGIGISLSVLTILAFITYVFLTILPAISPACPFQTSFSEFLPRRFFHLLPFIPSNNLPQSHQKEQKGGEARVSNMDSVPSSISLSVVLELLSNLTTTPKQEELENEVLAWIIGNSSFDISIHEAVKAVTGSTPTHHLRKTLISSGAAEVLLKRFNMCFIASPGLPLQSTDIPKTELYLYALLRCLLPLEPLTPGYSEERHPNDLNSEDLSAAFTKFYSALRKALVFGNPLYRWDDFHPCLHSLGCAVQTAVLVRVGMDEHGQNLSRTLSSAEGIVAGKGIKPDVRDILTHIMLHGLFHSMPNLTRICTVVLSSLLFSPKSRRLLGNSGQMHRITMVWITLLEDDNDAFRIYLPYVTNSIVSLLTNREFQPQIMKDEVLQTILQCIQPPKTFNVYPPFMCAAEILVRWDNHEAFNHLSPLTMSHFLAKLRISEGEQRNSVLFALAVLSEKEYFDFQDLVPHLLDLLDIDVPDLQCNVAISLVNLSARAEYRVLLGNSIPRILESLLTAIRWSPYWPGRYSAAAKALGKLAKITDYTRYVRDAVIEAFKVIKITEAEEGLLRIMEEFSELDSLLTEESLIVIFPLALKHIKRQNGTVQKIVIHLLSRLSDMEQCYKPIRGVIDDLQRLVKDKNTSVSIFAMMTLAVFKEEGLFDFNKIGILIHEIETNSYNSGGVAAAFIKLSCNEKIHGFIFDCLPSLFNKIKLLDDGCWLAVADIFIGLTKYSLFLEPILEAFPNIIEALPPNSCSNQRIVAALIKLSEQPQFRSHIRKIVQAGLEDEYNQAFNTFADSPPFSRTSDIDTSSGFISGKQASSQAYLSSGLRISHQMAEPNILLDNPSKAIPQRHLLGSSYTDIFSCLPGCFQSGDPRLISCGTRVLGALLHWSTSQFWTFSSFYNDTDYQFVPKYTFFFLPSIDRKNSHDFFSKYSVQAFKAFSKYDEFATLMKYSSEYLGGLTFTAHHSIQPYALEVLTALSEDAPFNLTMRSILQNMFHKLAPAVGSHYGFLKCLEKLIVIEQYRGIVTDQTPKLIHLLDDLELEHRTRNQYWELLKSALSPDELRKYCKGLSSKMIARLSADTSDSTESKVLNLSIIVTCYQPDDYCTVLKTLMVLAQDGEAEVREAATTSLCTLLEEGQGIESGVKELQLESINLLNKLGMDRRPLVRKGSATESEIPPDDQEQHQPHVDLELPRPQISDHELSQIICVLNDENGESTLRALTEIRDFLPYVEQSSPLSAALRTLVSLIGEKVTDGRYWEIRELCETILITLCDKGVFTFFFRYTAKWFTYQHSIFHGALFEIVPEIIERMKEGNYMTAYTFLRILQHFSAKLPIYKVESDDLRQSLLTLLRHNNPNYVSDICELFGHISHARYWSDMALPLILTTFHELHPDHTGTGGAATAMGKLTTLIKFDHLRRIVHEVGAVYSFLYEFFPGLTADQRGTMISQMHYYGMLKSL